LALDRKLEALTFVTAPNCLSFQESGRGVPVTVLPFCKRCADCGSSGTFWKLLPNHRLSGTCINCCCFV